MFFKHINPRQEDATFDCAIVTIIRIDLKKNFNVFNENFNFVLILIYFKFMESMEYQKQ